MCDFGISEAIIASAIVSAVSAIAGTAVSVTSAVQSANAQKAQYEYQSKIAQKNANIAQANADQKRQEGIEEARMQRIKSLQNVGSQQAAMAANGIDVSSGTALDIAEDTAAMGELEALTTRYNYESQALAYEQQAENYNNQSTLDSIAATNAYKSGVYSALGSTAKGLGSLSSVADKWYSSSSSGLSGSSTKVSGGIYGDNITYA